MADNVSITPGSGATIATDEVTDGTLGTVQVQFLKLMDGTLNGTNKATVNASGRLAIDGTVTVNTADGSGYTPGSSGFAPAGGFFQTTPTNGALANGTYGIWQMTANRAGFVNLRNAAGTELATSGAPLRVDPTGTTTQPVSGTFWQATQPVSGTVSATQSGNWTSRCVGNAGGTFDFASTQNVAAPGQAILIGGEFNTTPTTITTGNASPLQLDNAGNLLVNIKASVNQQVVGEVASGASDSGNPQKIGGVGRTTNPTAVTDGQRVNAIFDKLGKQVCVGAIRDLKAVQKTTITSSTAETTIVTQIAATFNDLYGLTIANTSATACNVTIKDSTAGTTRMILACPAGDTRGFMVPVDSAIVQATVNTNWTATCSASVASIEITALYVKNI